MSFFDLVFVDLLPQWCWVVFDLVFSLSCALPMLSGCFVHLFVEYGFIEYLEIFEYLYFGQLSIGCITEIGKKFLTVVLIEDKIRLLA